MVEAENQSEEAEWILAQARGLGVEIARRTLADWHAEGLIPAPEHVGLGQGHGSKSVYPAGTLSQLVACHNLLRKRYGVEKVRWELWARGYAISATHADQIFSTAHSYLVAFRIRTQRLEASDDAWHELGSEFERAGTGHRFPQLLSRVRQRLGDNAINFMMLIANIALGNFIYSSQSDEDGKRDRNLLTRGLNIISAKNKKSFGSPIFTKMLPMEFTRIMSEVSSVIPQVCEKEFLANLSHQQLREATTDVYAALRAYEIVKAAEEKQKRGQHPFYALLPLVLRRISAEKIAIIVLIWCAMREFPEFGEGAQDVRNSLERNGLKITDISII